ncbi:MAG: hypothetical protein ACK2U6_04225, partial [Candidatus Promineifilaceae bacterium]
MKSKRMKKNARSGVIWKLILGISMILVFGLVLVSCSQAPEEEPVEEPTVEEPAEEPAAEEPVAEEPAAEEPAAEEAMGEGSIWVL